MAEAGYHTIGGSQDFNASDDGFIHGPYTVGAGSTITEFHYALAATGSGDTSIRPLIYADSGGEPGALIATLTQITVLSADTTMSWRDVVGLSVPVSVNDIWIGAWFQTGGSHRYAYNAGGSGRYKSVLAAYSSTGDAPDPWPAASDTTSTQQVSVYVVYTPAATSQVLLPSADSVDGTWTDQAGGTSLAAAIDETTASDTDYIRSVLAPSNAACRVKLASGGDPASSTGHSVKWRIAKDAAAGGTIGMTVKLYQGGGNVQGAGTLIATFTRSNVSETFTDFTETLSGGEADSITNYGDLYLEFSANQT